ncbi:MAG: undecaprenyl-diphosphate phosphatase [Candidatus Aenigmarchaeota archaeon]|nr:undecaprenyl-diphosphate phosphatase [Candidatus Aenigmarchaeota archaeon]
MVGILEAVFLGALQGVTEWLPVSSSGHLALAQSLLGLQAPLLFDTALHAGTLLAVLAFFWKDVLKMANAVLRLDFRSEYGRLAVMVVIGTLPVVLAGVMLHDAVEALFGSPMAIGVSMMLMGTLLYVTKFPRGERAVGAKDALFIGAAQALSLVPGISRSGSTIAAGLSRHVERQKAFLFSFMLSIPAVVGANAYEVYMSSPSTIGGLGIETAAAVAVSALLGYAAIRALKKIFDSGRFHMFAYYCWVAGAAVVAYAYLFLG